MNIEIIGYTQEEKCDHCGRALKHVVLTDNAGKIGTSCFVKITKPCTYNGKTYKTSTTTVKDLAKAANLSPAMQTRYGYQPRSFIFELIDEYANAIAN